MFFGTSFQRYSLSLLALSALVACGGGGSNALPDAIATPVTTKASSETTTASAGLSFIVSGRAESQPNALSSMKWTASALTAGAPELRIANADCSSGAKTNRSVNGISQSTWSCDAVVTVPAGLTLNSDYRLSFQAADAKGNSSTDSLNVAATKAVLPGPPTSPTVPSTPPVVTTNAEINVAGGSLVNLSCLASGGTPGPANS